MNNVLKTILIVMLTLAVFCFCFDLTSYDFFEVLHESFRPIEKIADKAFETVSFVFGSDRFELEDKLIVWRYYFDDGNYCDIGCKMTIAMNFGRKSFLYSSNEDVRGYYRFKLLRTAQEGIWSCVFYGRGGEEIYKPNIFHRFYALQGVTYKDYLAEYQKDPSKDGWKA